MPNVNLGAPIAASANKPSTQATPVSAPAVARNATEPEPLDAFDYLERIGETAVHWWSLIDHVLEVACSINGKEDPAPKWVLDILKDQGRHDATEAEFSRQREGLRELLRLAEGKYTYCYEVWAKQSIRLSLRHESVADAMPARDYWRANGYPDANIIRLHRRATTTTANGLAMLETLIGQVWFAGATLARGPEGEHILQIMDETGRTVELSAADLRGHPIIDRMRESGVKESFRHWLLPRKTQETL